MSDVPVPEGTAEAFWLALGGERVAGGWRTPERDADGKVIGWHTRRDDGGHRNEGPRGLTLQWPLPDEAGQTEDRPVFVCEGVSDTVAGLGLGLDVVGAPMAGHGGDMLAELLQGRHVVIVQDADPAGTMGAQKLQSALLGKAASVRMICPLPPHKDFRAWVADGMATAADVLALAAEVPMAEDPDWLDKIVGERASTEDSDGQFQPFPIDVLPQPVAQFVREASESVGCDPSFVAVPALAAMAGAIGNTHRIVLLEDSWSEPAILWTAIIGESGTRKSPAMEHAISVTWDRQKEAMAQHGAALKQAETKEEKAAVPACERFIVEDTTIEALADRLSGAPRGLLMARDELDAFFGSFNQYRQGKGGDVAHYLTIHGGRPLLLDRRTGEKRTLFVPRAALSITGGIQPETLRRALDQKHFENGMAARFLFTMPPRTMREPWPPKPIGRAAKSSYAGIVGHLLDLPMGERPTMLPLSPAAEVLWGTFVNDHAKEQYSMVGDLGKAWSKLEGCAARLALVLHLARVAAGEVGYMESSTIDADTMRGGILLCRWFANETKRVYAMMAESEAEQDRKRMVDLLERKGSVTVREWANARSKSSDEAEAELVGLVDAGLAQSYNTGGGPKGGRPTVRYRMVS